MGALALAAYFPGFFRIHLRYIRNYPIVWAGLFVAPFLAIKMALVTIFGWFNTQSRNGLVFDVMAIFLIALCFFAAERHREFRRIYVIIAPLIIFVSLIYWAWKGQGFPSPGFLVLAFLIWLLSISVWKLAGKKGYQALSDGGSRKFAKARKFYEHGDYERAVKLLEKTAKKKHFKSLFLLGEFYEQGHYYDQDLFKAAELYLTAGKKGYSPARERFRAIYDQLSKDEHNRLEKNMIAEWLES